jgi:hypothetical protein
VLEGEVRSPHLLPARDNTAVSETTRPQAARDPEPALVWSKEASRHGVAPIACAHNRLAELATVALVPDAAGPSEETGEATRCDLLRCLFGWGSATAPARLRCRAVLRACGRPGYRSLAPMAQRSQPRAQGQGLRPTRQRWVAAHAAAPRRARRSMRRSPGLWALVDRGRRPDRACLWCQRASVGKDASVHAGIHLLFFSSDHRALAWGATRWVVYLPNADKYRRLTRRPSQGQKGIDERTLLAS